MAYASACQVAVLTQNLLGAASAFSASSSPTSTAVTQWLTSGCGVINTRLASYRYAVPVPADTALYDWISDLNALYAAARAELSRTNITIGPGERTRGQYMMKEFEDGMKLLGTMDLTLAGATRSGTVGKLYVGGLTQSDKDSMADGMLEGRFRRGMFHFDGTLEPDADTSAS